MDLEHITTLEQRTLQAIREVSSPVALEAVSLQALGRSSELTQLLRNLKDLSDEERRQFGPLLQDIKERFTVEIEKKRLELQTQMISERIAREKIDITAPGQSLRYGHLHPLTLVRREIESIFRSMGFLIWESPEIDSEWYNFDAVNMPDDHPARDMQATFWLKQSEAATRDHRRHMLPRTQVSNTQVRYLEKHQPPFRVLYIGKTFRNEATDATHEMQFYQWEGLVVDQSISLVHLKGILEYVFKRFFGKDIDLRFVPSYFPFTEPSMEVFVRIKGTTKISNTWLEMGGAGMVHQNVFKAAGFVPGEQRGIAFGMTIDRLALLKYGIDDIRLLHSGDLRFLEQF